MEFEVCIDSVEGAIAAAESGADRMELCSAFSEGGLTPSAGLIKSCAENSGLPVFAMVRPEAGGFCYSRLALDVMAKDIEVCAHYGATGVVFGVLNQREEIDAEANSRLLDVAESCGLQSVFHRAFDVCSDPQNGLNLLIELGFHRLLTSGQQPSAMEGMDMIKDLLIQAAGRMQIMAGSGVNAQNASTIMESRVDAIHFSGMSLQKETPLGMGMKYAADTNKIQAILALKSV